MSPGMLHYQMVLVIKIKHEWLMISKLFNFERDSTGSDIGIACRKKELNAEQEVWCAEPKKPGLSRSPLGDGRKHEGCGEELDVFDSAEDSRAQGGKPCKHKGHEIKAGHWSPQWMQQEQRL